MAGRKRRERDLTGIRQRGGAYQVRIFGGAAPVTGKQVILTGSAQSETAAIELRDRFRQQVRESTAARTNAATCWTSGCPALVLGDTTLAKLSQLGPRPFEQLYADLRKCRKR